MANVEGIKKMLPNGLLKLLLLLACTLIALPALSATSLSASATAQFVVVDHKDSDQSAAGSFSAVQAWVNLFAEKRHIVFSIDFTVTVRFL